MQLYLARHTQVDVPTGTCYGQSDVGLAPSHLAEFEKITTQLQGLTFDYVFTSPLSRCQKLTKALSHNLALPEFKLDSNLLELNFGDWEMLNWKAIEQTENAKFWFEDYIQHSTPNGESYMDLVQRVQLFIHQLKLLPDTATVLIVTHGGVVRAFNSIIKNTGVEQAFDLNVEFGEIIKLSL